MKMNLKYTLLNLLFVPFFTQAIGISSMVEYGKDNKASFTISNGNTSRQFIHVGITKVVVTPDGGVKRIPFDRDNIADWDLQARPSKTIIDLNLNKRFSLEHTPKTAADEQKDHAYYVAFVPTAATETGKMVLSSKMTIGFSPLVIFPAKEDKPLKYKMTYDKAGLKLKNLGETFIRVAIDGCKPETKKEERAQCMTSINALSGRDLPIALPSNMQKASSLRIELSTNNYKFTEKFTISKGKTVVNKAA